MQLLGLLKSLRLPDCNLKVLDVPITVAQRVEAWCRYGGGSQVCFAVFAFFFRPCLVTHTHTLTHTTNHPSTKRMM